MEREERGGGLGGFLKEVTIVVVGALIASTLLRLLLLQVFSIPSRSMESTLEVGDRVAVQKVQPFQRGDVVVFRDDLEWLGNPDMFSQEPWQDVLVFIGLKMCGEYAGEKWLNEPPHFIPAWVSLLVIATFLTVSIVASVVATRRENGRDAVAEVEAESPSELETDLVDSP